MPSDWLFTSAVGVYMLAALLSAVEYVLVIVLFNLFFVNLVVAGLHSYAGVN